MVDASPKHDGQTVKTKRRNVEESMARFRTIILAIAAVVIIGVIAGVAICQNCTAPLRTTVIVVGDRSINMHFFLKRIYVSGSEPKAVLC